MLLFLILTQLGTGQGRAQTPLEGSWVQSCQNNTLRRETFSGNDVILSENYFAQADCTQPILTFQSEGTHQEAGAQDMDFRFSAVKITLQMEVMVSDYNTRQVCGFLDWKLNQEREITGLSCNLFAASSPSPIPKKDDRRFGIYKIEGDHLFFGQLNQVKNALTPEARPTDWDTRFYVKH